MRWQCFAIPKQGNSAQEYEDAFRGNPKTGRFAIADGASESSFASLWAQLLVSGFAHAPTKVTGWRWLDPLRQEWAAQVDILPLPWYADEKRGQGAAATFLGLTLKGSAQTGRGVWSASAVGDCCCFQIHRDRLVRSFPLRRSQDFSNRPELLNSKSEDKSSPGHHRRYTRGRWRVKDRFLLMTDAIAHWFLSRHEAKGKPWNLLAPVLAVPQPAQAFESWIEALREHSDLRNDDITIAIIDL